MTSGLGWSPAYLLDMSGGDKGDLILNAIVVNDALDLQSVKVQFATGEASFPFSYLASPLFDTGITTAEIMRAVMAFVDQGPYTWRGSRYDNSMNMMQAQQMMAPPPPGGEVILAHEETWLYGPAEVSLARGERMILPLGKGSIPAKLVYYWEVPNPPSADASVNTVRLAAALTNTLDFPLTTGPMLITKDGRPLGQGAIRYTHQGEKTIVPFSLGSGVLCSGFEQEAGRDRASLRLGDTKYDKVSIKGTLQIRNALARDATVHVKRELSGKLRTASDDGKVEERLASAWDPNPTSTVRWVLEVGKGATREISYQYDYFVPSGSYSY
jgi:hypothetical protein